MVGVRSREDALQLAEEVGLDLVEIQRNADPPVCKIMDFCKFRFDQQKTANEVKKKTKQVEIKEIKIRPVADRSNERSGGKKCVGTSTSRWVTHLERRKLKKEAVRNR